MSIFEKILEWFGVSPPKQPLDRRQRPRPKEIPLVTFSKIVSVPKPPRNHEIVQGRVYHVIHRNRSKWALFACPCGCGSVITLSLQRQHRTHWRLSKDSANLPSLHPSVWKDQGCLSHFWLRNGRVFWSFDSGTAPTPGRYGFEDRHGPKQFTKRKPKS